MQGISVHISLVTHLMVIGSRQRLFTFSAGELNLNLFFDGISLRKVSKAGCLTKCKGSLKDLLSTIYKTTIEPYFHYCSVVWDSVGLELTNQ